MSSFSQYFSPLILAWKLSSILSRFFSLPVECLKLEEQLNWISNEHSKTHRNLFFQTRKCFDTECKMLRPLPIFTESDPILTLNSRFQSTHKYSLFSLLLVMDTRRKSSGYWQKCKQFCQNLNLFPSAPPSTDDHELRSQRISTRLFIFLLILALTILLSYTSLTTVTKTISVHKPSLTEYSQLYSKHSQSLICPCTQISVSYEKFIHVEYTLHQVCNSIYVTDDWILHLLSFDLDRTFHLETFAGASSYAFPSIERILSVNWAHPLE